MQIRVPEKMRNSQRRSLKEKCLDGLFETKTGTEIKLKRVRQVVPDFRTGKGDGLLSSVSFSEGNVTITMGMIVDRKDSGAKNKRAMIVKSIENGNSDLRNDQFLNIENTM